MGRRMRVYKLSDEKRLYHREWMRKRRRERGVPQRRFLTPEERQLKQREWTRSSRLRRVGPSVIKTPEERFFEKTISEPHTGCWLWLGTVQKNGYGRFGFGQHKSGLVHRWSYSHFR